MNVANTFKISEVLAKAEEFGLMFTRVEEKGVLLVFDTEESCDRFTRWSDIEMDYPIGFNTRGLSTNATYANW
jgi:hypothetical protein